MGSSLRSTVEKQIYKWAISKKIGFSEDTAKALAHFAKFLQTGKGITKKEALRWQKIKRLVNDNNEGKAVVDKDRIKGLALSWILLGWEYEEKVERKEDKYRKPIREE